MQQRLAVKADRRHAAGLQIVGAEEGLHRFGVRVVHQLLRLGDERRPRRALGQVRRGGGSAA
jgi:hypothetical protein